MFIETRSRWLNRKKSRTSSYKLLSLSRISSRFTLIISKDKAFIIDSYRASTGRREKRADDLEADKEGNDDRQS